MKGKKHKPEQIIKKLRTAVGDGAKRW